MPYANVHDLDIHYESDGKGEPLILMHGLLGSIESELRPLIPLLSEHYHVIAVDLRGHGQTGNQTGELRNVQLREDLIGLLDALQIESSLVFGYSLGGYVGLMAGLESPGRIRALVMHSSKIFWDKAAVDATLGKLDPDRIIAKVPRYAELLQRIHGPERWRGLLAEAAAHLKTMLPEALTLEEARRADLPILVSTGDRDELVSVDEAVRFYRVLPRGELLVMPNTHHSFSSVRPEVFVPAMRDFFQRAVSGDIASR